MRLKKKDTWKESLPALRLYLDDLEIILAILAECDAGQVILTVGENIYESFDEIRKYKGEVINELTIACEGEQRSGKTARISLKFGSQVHLTVEHIEIAYTRLERFLNSKSTAAAGVLRKKCKLVLVPAHQFQQMTWWHRNKETIASKLTVRAPAILLGSLASVVTFFLLWLGQKQPAPVNHPSTDIEDSPPQSASIAVGYPAPHYSSDRLSDLAKKYLGELVAIRDKSTPNIPLPVVDLLISDKIIARNGDKLTLTHLGNHRIEQETERLCQDYGSRLLCIERRWPHINMSAEDITYMIDVGLLERRDDDQRVITAFGKELLKKNLDYIHSCYVPYLFQLQDDPHIDLQLPLIDLIQENGLIDQRRNITDFGKQMMNTDS